MLGCAVDGRNTQRSDSSKYTNFWLPSIVVLKWGASAPAPKVYEKYEITHEGIAKRAETVVAFYKKRGHVYSPIDTAL